MDAGRLNRAIFMFDKEKNQGNWNKKFSDMLKGLDMKDHWDRGTLIPIDGAKEKIKSRFENDWKHNCSTKPKLRTYITFVDKVQVASHINCNLPKYERSLISQLRLGILPLRIETGRYANTKECDRICLLCQQNKVESEAHFLFECDLYDSERNQFETGADINFRELNLVEKFRNVFKHPYRLGKFMKTAMDKRKRKLYKA